MCKLHAVTQSFALPQTMGILLSLQLPGRANLKVAKSRRQKEEKRFMNRLRAQRTTLLAPTPQSMLGTCLRQNVPRRQTQGMRRKTRNTSNSSKS